MSESGERKRSSQFRFRICILIRGFHLHDQGTPPHFLCKEMTEEEERLLEMINEELAKAGLHLRLMTVEIDTHGSISAEFCTPIGKWISEELQATAIVQEEIAKYQCR